MLTKNMEVEMLIDEIRRTPAKVLTEEQREVLSGLTPQELALLLDVKSRLDAVGPEVQAHGEIAGGALF